MGRWIDELVGTWVEMDGWINRCWMMEGGMSRLGKCGWMGGWVDEEIGEWMDRRMDMWIDDIWIP